MNLVQFLRVSRDVRQKCKMALTFFSLWTVMQGMMMVVEDNDDLSSNGNTTLLPLCKLSRIHLLLKTGLA